MVFFKLQCFAAKTLTITTNPPNALVISHKDSTFVSILTNYHGTSPTEAKLTFIGKKDYYYITVEKRGFESQTVYVTKDSVLNLHFDLKRIPEVADTGYHEIDYSNVRFHLLPLSTNVIIHSGVGNLDKYTPSPEASNHANSRLNKLIYEGSDSAISVYPLQRNQLEQCMAYKDSLPYELKEYLLTLNMERLKYYPLPANIKPYTEMFGDFRSSEDSLTNDYYICLWIKCISETKGRVAGNILASFGAAVTSGASTAYGTTFCYDPTAFNLDSGSKLVYFVIDPITLEVVDIRYEYTGYVLNKDEYLDKIADLILHTSIFSPKTSKK